MWNWSHAISLILHTYDHFLQCFPVMQHHTHSTTKASSALNTLHARWTFTLCREEEVQNSYSVSHDTGDVEGANNNNI